MSFVQDSRTQYIDPALWIRGKVAEYRGRILEHGQSAFESLRLYVLSVDFRVANVV